MGRIARYFRRRFGRRFGGQAALAAFFGATLGLTLWLGYEALNAAASHRRTAEDVLGNYASIAAVALSREVDDHLDDALEVIFDDIEEALEQVRRDRRFAQRGFGRRDEPAVPPTATAVLDDMDEAMADEGCSRGCRGFRSPLAVFRVVPAGGGIEWVSDSLSSRGVPDIVVQEVLAQPVRGESSEGLLTTDGGGLFEDPLVVGYFVWSPSPGVVEAAYGFVTRPAALGELFRVWYQDEELLPPPVGRDQPNDSVLYVHLRTPRGAQLFASAAAYETAPSASDTLDATLGGLVIEAMIRPDAAEQLVIGGLPRSRLPLLAVLLVLTLGIGLAAFVQLRRELTFQRLRDDFVSGVSHELRTPLAQIRMFAELQEAGMLRTEEDRRRATRAIHRESRRLTHLVENILQFSRLRRTPEQRMPLGELDLSDALADGLDAVTPLLADRGMKLDLSAEQGLRVVGNRDALTRIVVNLLDNAVKYGPAGQTVRVAVERAEGSARLSVADQGPGVPAADRERIWKPYRRLERDIKAQLPGTGIGLSVVQELAHLHGGRARVEDAPGGGACFVIELPLAAGRAPEGTPLAEPRPHPAKEAPKEHPAVA